MGAIASHRGRLILAVYKVKIRNRFGVRHGLFQITLKFFNKEIINKIWIKILDFNKNMLINILLIFSQFIFPTNTQGLLS